jgi:hypothetical protein
MQHSSSRRQFLREVGQGTLLATIGPALASELGIRTAHAEPVSTALSFGEMESLVCLMQETEVAKLQPLLVSKLKSGTTLKQLMAAGALANARTFGGEDYVGFHTAMAMMPALRMADAMSAQEQALPVLKVLYRNTNRIQEHGGRTGEVLHPVSPGTEVATDEQLHAAVKRKDTAGAERLFATMMQRDKDEAFNALLHCVQDDTEVHRTVLPYRAWDLLDVVGLEHAHTLLRQSLRYCLQAEGRRRPEWDEHGKVLVKLLDEHRLHDRQPGTRSMDDGAVSKLSETIFKGSPADAAGAVAAALANGFDPSEIGEAISLAANQLVLHDLGRPPAWEAPGKPAGSVHGDSIGVHASDSAHAWRNLSRVSRGTNTHACLILGALQMARDAGARPEIRTWDVVPSSYQLGQVNSTGATALIHDLEEAVRGNLQGRAAAVATRCRERAVPVEQVFASLRRFAISEDGALHAEKYFQTVSENFRTTRPAFQWQHLVALARVTASEFGRAAPGQAEARELLKV